MTDLAASDPAPAEAPPAPGPWWNRTAGHLGINAGLLGVAYLGLELWNAGAATRVRLPSAAAPAVERVVDLLLDPSGGGTVAPFVLGGPGAQEVVGLLLAVGALLLLPLSLVRLAWTSTLRGLVPRLLGAGFVVGGEVATWTLAAELILGALCLYAGLRIKAF